MKVCSRILSLLLLIAYMLLIFNFSAQTATESSDVSGGFSYKLASLFIEGFEDKTEEEQQEIIEKMSFPIRKTAHFCIFAGLSMLALLNINFFNIHYFLKNVLAFIFSALYAASDEYHQKFVEGRSCEVRDWLIDCGGVLAGLLVCGVLIIIIKRIKLHRGGNRNMRKKELINQNKLISEELLKERQNNDSLMSKLKEKAEQITLLNGEIEELKRRVCAEEKIEFINPYEKTENEVNEVSDEKENLLNYGAVIIGKVVMSAAENCGRMTSDDEERLNNAMADIFERMESVKAEIFDIISSDNSEYTKRALMEREYHSAVNFFDRTASRV